MDLGIAGRKALVCAASRGLGKGCAQALAREGVHVTLVARTAQTLEQAVAELQAEVGSQTRVAAVTADITTVEGRALALAACPAPDILVNNAGGPPAGNFRDWSRENWIAAIDANMLTPIELIKATVDGMMARGFGRIVNITSAAVKAPYPSLGLSNGARSGLTGFVAGIARETVARNVTINNLLPGFHDTDRLRNALRAGASQSGATLELAIEKSREQLPARRFGTAEEFGAFCAFLCSSHAGFMTGQNILLDGGAYPGTL